MKAGPLIRKDQSRKKIPSSAAEEVDAVPAESAPLPDLPDISLSPTPLARGPLAAVYRGWDRVKKRDVIVKVQRAAGDPIAAERFRREAVVMGRLCHPNIVALYRYLDGDPAALVLEYVSGQTLADLVTADGRLSPERAVQIIEEIAAALDCAHAQGVIHRDVKPSNILLSRRGPALLTDFGVAHIDDDTPLTVMGDILGTIEYASPEQVHGNETPDARSDVYSLAAVAYFALTATPPFRAADSSTQAQLSVMHRQVFAEPPPLRFHREDLAPEIEAAVLRGLAKAPASRYPSAGQFAATLRAALRAGAASPAPRAVAAAFGRNGALAGAAAAAVLLLLGGVAYWKTTQPAVPAKNRPLQTAQGTTPAPPVKAASVPQPTAVTVKPNIAAAAVEPKPRPSTKAALIPAPKPPVPVAPPVNRHLIAVRPAARLGRKAAHPAAAYLAVSHPKPLPNRTVVAQRPKPVRRFVADAVPVHPPKPLPVWRPASRIAPAGKVAQAMRPAPPTGTAWLFVYANQNVAPLGSPPRMASIPAQSVWVDGSRASDLASGHWTSLPAGRHVVSFVPDPRSGFAPHKDMVVMLAPGAYVSRQILLPLAPSSAERVAVGSPAAPAPSKPVASPPFIAWAQPPIGWYTVSGWVAVTPPGKDAKPTLTRASADWVKVDGHPVQALALGQWAQLPAGKHVVTFQPTAGIGVGPKTWNIDLAPRAHLDQKIPLPPFAPPSP